MPPRDAATVPARNHASWKPASFPLALFLFLYHVALGLVLAYAIYNVWPPQPWPKEPPPTASGQRPGARADATGKKGQNPTATDTTASQTATDTTASRAATDGAGNAATGNAARSGTPSESEAAEAELSSYGGELPPPFWLFCWKFTPPLETRLILLVLRRSLVTGAFLME